VTYASGLCILPDGTVLDGVAAPLLGRVRDVTVELYDELHERDPSVLTPCAVLAVAGVEVPLDRGTDLTEDCCGQLWVRLVSSVPSRNFPEPDAGPHTAEMSWAVTIEVGVARPAPVVTEVDGAAVLPPIEDEEEAASVAAIDAAILREALLNRYADAEDVGIVLGAWTPFGPDGGIVGGLITATIQVV